MRILWLPRRALPLAAADDNDLATPQECNPPGGTACTAPWPSAIYEIDDATTATGFRLDIRRRAADEHRPDHRGPRGLQHGRRSSAAPRITAFQWRRRGEPRPLLELRGERHGREPDGPHRHVD
jgi:hypothetical protein